MFYLNKVENRYKTAVQVIMNRASCEYLIVKFIDFRAKFAQKID